MRGGELSTRERAKHEGERAKHEGELSTRERAKHERES